MTPIAKAILGEANVPAHWGNLPGYGQAADPKQVEDQLLTVTFEVYADEGASLDATTAYDAAEVEAEIFFRVEELFPSLISYDDGEFDVKPIEHGGLRAAHTLKVPGYAVKDVAHYMYRRGRDFRVISVTASPLDRSSSVEL